MTHEGREYDVIIEANLKTRMRDGVTLYSDAYRPARDRKAVDGRFSSILVRTFRNKEAVFDIDAHRFAKAGFVVIFQDIRGRYKSEGSFYHGRMEAEDGYDTVEWIASQPWSNGKVGMTGISYLAAVQCAAAIANPPHLASLFHVQGPVDYFGNHYRRGGETNLYTVPIVLMFAADSKEALGNPAIAKSFDAAFSNARDWMKRWPLKKGLTPLSQTPSLEDWLLDPLGHPDYDDFWKKVPLWQPIEFLDKYADVSGYYISGWFDPYREDLLYSGLAPRKSQPLKLMMGPWLHNDFGRSAGDVDFGPDAVMDSRQFNELQLGWFRQTLDGDENGMFKEHPVKIFVMGGGSGRKTPEGRLDHGGRWRYEDEWPITRTKYTPFYLREDGLLTSEKGAASPSSTTYTYDPADPVPTIGSNFFFLELTALAEGAGYSGGSNLGPRKRRFVTLGPRDQKESPDYFGCTTSLPLSSRHDVAVFQTPPLTVEAEVSGPVVAKLWASSSAVDTDFTAKLIDVHPPNMDYPDGYAMNLSNSLIRASYRNGFEMSELIKPGERYEFTIDMPAVSNVFAKGHRIRLDISSSNYPEFDVNPNTGRTHAAGGRTIVADNTIYHDSAHASHVVLPIIP